MFPERLRTLMKKRGLNGLQLAKKAHISQPLISRYLRSDPGGKYPSFKTLLDLAATLRCTLYELTGDERLRDVEADMAKIKEIPPEAEELWEAYKSLDDDNPVKHFIEATLLGKKPDEPKRDDQHGEPEKAG